jgi:hypothetical protein
MCRRYVRWHMQALYRITPDLLTSPKKFLSVNWRAKKSERRNNPFRPEYLLALERSRLLKRVRLEHDWTISSTRRSTQSSDAESMRYLRNLLCRFCITTSRAHGWNRQHGEVDSRSQGRKSFPKPFMTVKRKYFWSSMIK